MEKRVLLAFGLSMLVFFVYVQFFAPRPAPRPPAGAAAPVTAPTEAAIAAAPAAEAAAPAAPAPAAATAESLVTLEGARADATISTTRSLTHWVLDGYQVAPGDGGAKVDLAAQPGAGFGLSLFENGAAPAFAIAARTTDSVQLVARSGAVVETRRWKVEGYVAHLTWTARNEGDRAVVIHPTARLTSDINYEAMSAYDVHGPAVARGEEVERPDEDEITAKAAYRDVRWAGFDDKYFLKAVVPAADQRDVGSTVSIAGKLGDVSNVALTVELPEQTLAPGGEWAGSLKLYLGPKIAHELQAVNQSLANSIDYGFFAFLAKPLLALLKFFHNLVANWGVAIILLTLLIKVLFYPLTAKSFTAMRDMQRIQPKLEELKKKYEKDRDRLNREMMNLYRTEGINPLGGCLPMLLQIPVFFALYQVLLTSIELRHAPFMLWVNDLSAPENLFSLHLGGIELPFRLLPLVMGVTMVLQQKLTPSTMDKVQQQIMLIMPVMFTFLFWGFPSGLVLYWLVNNVISIAQQWWITRSAKAAA